MIKTIIHSQKFLLLFVIIALGFLIAMSRSMSLFALDQTISVELKLLSYGIEGNVSKDPPLIKIIFSETIINFDLENINIKPEITLKKLLNQTDGDREFEIMLTPVADGEVMINIPADTFYDAEGNTNQEVSFTILYDTFPPYIEILESSVSNRTEQLPIPITAVFSEKMYNFLATDIVIDKGTLSGFASEDDTTFTFKVRPTAIG